MLFIYCLRKEGEEGVHSDSKKLVALVTKQYIC